MFQYVTQVVKSRDILQVKVDQLEKENMMLKKNL